MTGPWAQVVLLFAAGLGAAGQFAKLSAGFPALEAAYPGAGASLGFAVTLISLLGLVLGLVAGMIVASLGYARVLVWALAGGAVLSAVQALLPPMPLFLLTRMLEGGSHLAIVVAAPTLIAEITNDRQRPTAMALWSTFFGTGFALYALVGPALSDAHGPAPLIWIHAAWMAAMALLIRRYVPSGKAPRSAASLDLRAVLKRHATVYTAPDVAAPAFGWLCYTLTFVAVLTVLPRLAEAGWLATVLPLIGIVLSLSVVSLLLQHRTAVTLVMVGFGLAAVLALAIVATPGAAWLWVALFGVLALVQAGTFAAIPELCATAEDRALANGAVAQMGNLGNLAGTPILLVALAASGPRGAVALLALAYAAGLIVHLRLAKRRAAAP